MHRVLIPCADRVDALVVSGGGMKGLASLGAVTALKKAGTLRHVRTVVGTSAGALVAAAFAVGRASEALLDELACERYKPDIDIQRVMTTFGLDTGRDLQVWISRVLGGQAYTFRDIRERYGVRLVVCATNVTMRRPEYFGPDTHPGMDVALALRMSCTVPLYFTAVRHDDMVFVDGAVSDNFPIDWTLRHHGPRVLGVAFAPRLGSPTDSIEAYVGALIECSTRRPFAEGRRHPRQVLELRTGAKSAFEFGMGRADMRRLFDTGARQARMWVKKHK